jgi:hypothetical protein
MDNKIFDYEKYLLGRTLSREEECQYDNIIIYLTVYEKKLGR